MSHLQADAPDEIGTYFSDVQKLQPDLHAVFYRSPRFGCFPPGLDSRRKLPEASSESSCRVEMHKHK